MRTKKSAGFAILFVVLALALLAYYQNFAKTPACKGFASCFSGKTDRVIDGDTLVIANITVRLALVNTPEKFEDEGILAYNFTSTLCSAGSDALVDEDDDQQSGSYGRMIAVVYCNGKNLNELLLENGLGAIYASYCKGSEFKNEKWAKMHGC